MNPFIFEFILQFIKYLLIFSGLYFLLKYYFDRKFSNEKPDPFKTGNTNLQTLRMQAYERFVLFLERNDPSSLVLRLNSPGLTARQLQALVVKSIREEFDYNISQQLYISENLWNMIKNSKEENIAMINQLVAGLDPDASAEELAHQVFSLSMTDKNHTSFRILSALRSEMENALFP